LGNDLYKQGEFDEAVQCYNLVLRMDPELLETYFNLGLAHTRKTWYDPALEDLSEVIALNPNLAEAYYTVGLVLEYKGEYTKAIEQYRRALEVDPHYEKAAGQIEVARKKEKGRLSSTSSSDAKTENKVSEELANFEPYIEKVKVTLDDFAGPEKTKTIIRRLCQTLAHTELVKRRGSQVPKGILVHGEPGTGKTHLARIMAHILGATFYNVKASDIRNLWYGMSERNLDKLFADAARHERSVIFFDEFDDLGARRTDNPGDCRADRGLVSCLLRNMDGLGSRQNNVIVLAATNDLAVIDKALLRPGRFTYCIKIDQPDRAALEQLFEIHLRLARMAPEPLPISEIDGGRLARKCVGLVGDDVREIVVRALDNQIREEIEHGSPYTLTTDHLLAEVDAYRQERKSEERLPAGFTVR
jgi:SpoVK/Ycf46/Vps4 family AAA+-type ATPase